MKIFITYVLKRVHKIFIYIIKDNSDNINPDIKIIINNVLKIKYISYQKNNIRKGISFTIKLYDISIKVIIVI